MAGNPTTYPNAVDSVPQPPSSGPMDTGAVQINPQGIASLGSMLLGRFKQYEWERRVAELQWERNARQVLGVYDPDIEQGMDINRSRAYPKLTRVKCVSMLSRLMNLLFPADDKNWSIAPSPRPNLSEEDLQTVLDSLMPPGPAAAGQPTAAPAAPQQPPSDDEIEEAIRKFAQKSADALSLEIADQLAELGGQHTMSYTALCRQVLQSGVQYGCGILKGPFVETQTQRTWQMDATGRLKPTSVQAFRPRYEFVPIWSYYPDMSAKTLDKMDGQFERVVLSKHQLIMLKNRPDFFADQIDVAMKQYPNGNYMRRAFETELLAMGPQLNVQQMNRNKYEAYVWEGHLTGAELANAGVKVSDKHLKSDVLATVWIVENVVIKAMVNPWADLVADDESAKPLKLYHHFIFEENETFLLGNGLPKIMRDSQLGLCAVVRMMIDNASIQRNIEVNVALLGLQQDMSSVEPDKVWYRFDTNPSTINVPAVRPVDLPMHLADLQNMAKMFMDFADVETFVNPATGGDMQKGPSEPFRTAAGASMLQGQAALPFKDVVRNFDAFTESMLHSLLLFNRKFNYTNPHAQGDFQPIARGATSLIAKEVLGIQLDQLASTLTEQEKPYLKARELLRQRVRVRDLQSEDLVMSDPECDQVDANMQAQQQAAQQTAQQQATATIKETLASALKDLAQAGKNTANANATTAQTMLESIDHGLNPDSLTPQGTGNDATATAGSGPAAIIGNTGVPAAGVSGAAANPAVGGRGGPAGAENGAGVPAEAGRQGLAAMPAAGTA